MTSYQKKGFTLVEVMVTTAFLSIFLTAAYGLWFGLTNVWTDNSLKTEMDTAAKKAFRYMGRDLRQAQLGSITTAGPSDNRSITFQVPYQSCDSQGNNCTWLYGANDTQNATITYLTDSGRLMRRVRDLAGNTLSDRVITDQVTALRFDQVVNDAYIQDGNGFLPLKSGVNDPKTYEIQITCSGQSISGRTLSATLVSRITMRSV